MRLLFVIQDPYPPVRVDVAELFGREMPARGHRIDWLMEADAGAAPGREPIRWLGNTVYLTRRPAGGGGVFRRLARNVRSLLNDLYVLPLGFRGRYDAIQVRDKHLGALAGLLAARLTGARFFYWMSYPLPEARLEHVRRGYAAHPGWVWLRAQIRSFVLYRVILPLCDHAFVQSEQMKADCAREGIRPEKMTPVPMGIRESYVRTAEDARPPRGERPMLLHLGLIMRLRQADMLVRVLERVRREHPGARLVYVGEGLVPEDRQSVEAEARRLGLADAVEITGFLPMQLAWQRVEQADVCLSPYAPIPVLQSTSPTKLIDYLALAKCIVASDHPEQTAILAESGAGTTVPWDEQAFADRIIEFLRDPEAAREKAARGPDWVRRHRTYRLIADELDRRYRALLDGRALQARR